MKPEEITEEKKTPNGTYAYVIFNKNTIDALQDYIIKNNIPNPVPIEKIHSTLLYSRNYLPEYKPPGKIYPMWEGKFKCFSIFNSNPVNSQDSSILVMEYTCSEQSKRFNELMDIHGATYDFNEYKIHITLSYNMGDFNIDNLSKFEKSLKITEEKSKNLKLPDELKERK